MKNCIIVGCGVTGDELAESASFAATFTSSITFAGVHGFTVEYHTRKKSTDIVHKCIIENIYQHAIREADEIEDGKSYKVS